MTFSDELLPPGFESTEPLSLVHKFGDADGVVVVDVSNMAYREAFACASMTTSDGRPSGHVYGSFRTLLSICDNLLDPGKWLFVFCYDGSGAKKKRQELLPTYKANREKRDWSPLGDVCKMLKLIPGIHIDAPGKEGDDAMAWAAQKMASKQVVVVSGDKDTWALWGGNVKIYNPNRKEFVTHRDIVSEFGIQDAAKIRIWKALFGDSSDGIKGPQRLLKKQVLSHIELATDLEDCLRRIEDADPKLTGPNTKQKVRDYAAEIRLNYDIVCPRLDFTRSDVVTVEPTEQNISDFRAIMETFEIKQLLPRIDFIFGKTFTATEKRG